ncbi:hypothetical protein ACFUYE_05375 [Micromonospora humida]|uniref:phage tail tube protein n=1 Tax=Micromonospora humida TaxID=2809018 RepID=UPI003671FB19
MPDIIVDGKIRVSYVASIANTSSPTTTELNGGLVLNRTITKDGLVGFEPDSAKVETTALDSEFNTNKIGRTSFGDTMLRLKKQSGTDTIYTTLVKNATGYLVIRRDLPRATAWTAGDKVEVYPIECGETRRLAPEENTLSRYEVPVAITDDVVLRATVA